MTSIQHPRRSGPLRIKIPALETYVVGDLIFYCKAVAL